MVNALLLPYNHPPMAKKEQDRFPLLDYIDEFVESLRGHVPKAMKHWESDRSINRAWRPAGSKRRWNCSSPCCATNISSPFHKVLRKLRRRLGPMRDLDVMIGHLAK